MLLVIAATGLLRGLQDTKTPLVVSIAGFALNAALNVLFIYGFGWGIAGSAVGTVIAQWAMGLVFVIMAVRAARSTGTPLRPGLRGVGSAAASGSWLLVRTASLRVAMLATVFVGSSLGVTDLAVLQIALTLFGLVALILDALAIAGQALIGHSIGAEDVPRISAITSRLIRLGLSSGVIAGVALAAGSWALGPVFSSDPAVHAGLTIVVLVMSVGIPLAGFVFVLDGVLIGAGDARYLALSGLVNLVAYLPLLAAVFATGAGIVWLWVAFGFGYIGARALTLGLRVRGTRWLPSGMA
jgi:putative MATE family efflux protein